MPGRTQDHVIRAPPRILAGSGGGQSLRVGGPQGEPQVASLGEVLRGKLLGEIEVLRVDGIDDRPMLAVRLVPPPRLRQGRRRVAREVEVDPREQVDQRLVVRGPPQSPVKITVGRRHLIPSPVSRRSRRSATRRMVMTSIGERRAAAARAAAASSTILVS